MRNLHLFAALALLSGCTVVRVERETLPEAPPVPSGEIRFMAVRKERPVRLADGYSLQVMKGVYPVGTCSSSSNGPASMDGLKPGTYDISVGGRGIGSRTARVKVRSGEATVIRLMVRNARAVDSTERAFLTAGKVLLYTIGGVIYVVAWVWLELTTGDDDDDDCPRSSSVPSKREPHPGSVGTYRKKN